MKQRADMCAAKFLRPKFVQMIEWQFNAHSDLLAQRLDSHEAQERLTSIARRSCVRARGRRFR